jgi:hypothetical protein
MCARLKEDYTTQRCKRHADIGWDDELMTPTRPTPIVMPTVSRPTSILKQSERHILENSMGTEKPDSVGTLDFDTA